MAVGGGTITTLTTTSDITVQGVTVGRGAGAVATNTAVGASALAANSSGPLNTALGNSALTANTTGGYNTAVGALALQSNVGAGEYNNAFGWQALKANTTGSENLAFGISAMLSNTTGSYNNAMGSNALRANTTGEQNVAIGYRTMFGNTTGGNNTAIGARALESTVGGGNNVAIGRASMYANTSGVSNVAVGVDALNNNATGQGSTAVGYEALKNATDQNTAFGYQAGLANTSGYFNLYVGQSAGSNAVTGAYNCYVGSYNLNASSTSVGSEMLIASGYNGGSTTGKGASTGFINPNGGGVYQGNNSSTWSTTSDRRLKKNIVDNTVGLDAITSIRVRNFEYCVAEEITELPEHTAIQKSGVQLGVIAQELNEVLPECIKTESTGVMSVNADNLTWYMVNAIKELSAKVQALEAQLNQ
jgi:hypothetical protein